MIRVSRLNGFKITVNAELIELIESNPDTTLCMVTGSRIVVREPVNEVIDKIMDYRRECLKNGKAPAELLLKTYKKEV